MIWSSANGIKVLIQFANNRLFCLGGNDVAARGLDISQLEVVINVDITPDAEIHIHRIGAQAALTSKAGR